MGKRKERAEADVRDWTDVAVWLSDVMDAVKPSPDDETVTLFPSPATSGS